MTPLRIRTKIEGDTLVLPELKRFAGKTVDIEVTERPQETLPAERWAAAAEAVKGLADYDFDAWSEQRAFDAERSREHLR